MVPFVDHKSARQHPNIVYYCTKYIYLVPFIDHKSVHHSQLFSALY